MLSQWFADMHGLEYFFLFCAVLGGAVVTVKVLAQLAGFGGEEGGEGSVDADAHHTGSDVGYQYLSLHGIASFLMMFGLFGLALYRQSRVGLPFSIFGAVLGGVGSMWIIGKVFQSAGRLQASGTLRTEDAVGSRGSVYMSIPAGGTGRVNIDFQGRLREFDAREKSGAALATDTPIRVVAVSGNVLIVERTA